MESGFLFKAAYYGPSLPYHTHPKRNFFFKKQTICYNFIYICSLFQKIFLRVGWRKVIVIFRINPLQLPIVYSFSFLLLNTFMNVICTLIMFNTFIEMNEKILIQLFYFYESCDSRKSKIWVYVGSMLAICIINWGGLIEPINVKLKSNFL